MSLASSTSVGLVLVMGSLARSEVTYVSQLRSLSTSAYGALDRQDQSVALGVFNTALISEAFVGPELARSAGSAALLSSLTSQRMELSLEILGDDQYNNFGVGGGGGSGLMDVVFHVASPTPFDFSAEIQTRATTPNFLRSLSGSLTGPFGTVFQLQPLLAGVQRFGGTLDQGDYHLLLSHSFSYGGFGVGDGASNLAVVFTVPSPAGCAALLLGLAGVRRRR